MENQPLEISQVLNEVYQKLKTDAKIVKEFIQTSIEWDRSEDPGKGRTYHVDYDFDGFIAEISHQSGVLVTIGSLYGKDYMKNFDQGVLLAKIFTGEAAKNNPEKHGNWEYTNYGSQEQSWNDVSIDHLRAVLLRIGFDFHPLFEDSPRELPAVYTLKNRLLLNRTEIGSFVSTPPKFNFHFAYQKSFRGFQFVLGENEDFPRYRDNEVPDITTPAQYGPRVVDFITKKLQQKTGINQPQLI